ncbi:MAG: flavodoxin family protein [Clostridiales bacterium]|nr:flavodoxin family protein [Clostridiales bacterium]
MNVLMINGSPHEDGCVFTALSEIAKELHKENIETTIFPIGVQPIYGCTGCGSCRGKTSCIFDGDPVNAAIECLIKADGLIVGSPVYYGGANGALCAFLDRMFFGKAQHYAYKPAAAIVNCRRGGAASAFDRLNKYFTISNMPVVPSQYWNATHGTTVEEVLQDLEGLQIMRTLGRNMAWMLNALASQSNAVPEAEKRVMTNFIRKS